MTGIAVRRFLSCLWLAGKKAGPGSHSVVEFGFGGWGDPPLPEDFSEIKPYFENFGGCEPVPHWLIEMIDILVEYKDQASIEGSRFREQFLFICK